MQYFFFAKIYSSMWDICFKTTIAALKCNVHTYNGFWNYVFPVHDIINLKHAYVSRLYNVHILKLHLLILDQCSSDPDLLETKAFIMATRLALKNTIYQGIKSNTGLLLETLWYFISPWGQKLHRYLNIYSFHSQDKSIPESVVKQISFQ